MGDEDAFLIGSISCDVISDGSALYGQTSLFAGVPDEELAPALEGWTDEDGNVPLGMSALLVRTGEQVILIDTGLGELADDPGVEGLLLHNLRGRGVDPEQVDLVVLSHCHPDHIGGLVQDKGGAYVPVFPNARYVFSSIEWAFWTSEEGLGRLSAGMADPARTILAALDPEMVQTLDGEAEIAPGLTAIPAPGHTAGHMAILLSSGEERGMYMGDAVLHQLNVEHPDWVSAYDFDPEATVASRRALLNRAADGRMRVVAFHIPTPGWVERGDTEYVFRSDI